MGASVPRLVYVDSLSRCAILYSVLGLFFREQMLWAEHELAYIKCCVQNKAQNKLYCNLKKHRIFECTSSMIFFLNANLLDCFWV